MTEKQNRTLQDKFMLRFPDGMRDRIKVAASRSNRSMNAEIVATLEENYPAPAVELSQYYLLKFLNLVGKVADIEGEIPEKQIKTLHKNLDALRKQVQNYEISEEDLIREVISITQGSSILDSEPDDLNTILGRQLSGEAPRGAIPPGDRKSTKPSKPPLEALGVKRPTDDETKQIEPDDLDTRLRRQFSGEDTPRTLSRPKRKLDLD